MDPLIAAYVMFIIFVFLGMALIDLAPLLKRSREVEYGKAYTPKTLVMVPCRGEDLTLKDNLVSISAQNYKNYSVMAIVDSADDPAVRYIRQAGMKFIVSDHKGGRSSGKVRAIITALKRFRGYDAYVIADSDILVGKNWLGELISPLQDGKIGVSTTFPKFVPRAGFWSKVKLVWGFVGEGMMKSASTRFGWGGSLAFRKELVNRKTMAMLEDSRYSVSDDICITRAAREAGLGLAYVGSAQPIVNSDDSFRKFIEWANRQTALSILGYRRNLYYGAAFLLRRDPALRFRNSPLVLHDPVIPDTPGALREERDQDRRKGRAHRPIDHSDSHLHAGALPGKPSCGEQDGPRNLEREKVRHKMSFGHNKKDFKLTSA